MSWRPDRDCAPVKDAISAVLAGLPNLIAASFAIAYMATHRVLAPASLAEVLGGPAMIWTWGVLLSLLATGTLAFFQRSIGAMTVELGFRFLAGMLLAGYSVSLISGGMLMTAGLALGFGVKQFQRCWYLQAERIPERRLVDSITREGERHGHR